MARDQRFQAEGPRKLIPQQLTATKRQPAVEIRAGQSLARRQPGKKSEGGVKGGSPAGAKVRRISAVAARANAFDAKPPRRRHSDAAGQPVSPKTGKIVSRRHRQVRGAHRAPPLLPGRPAGGRAAIAAAVPVVAPVATAAAPPDIKKPRLSMATPPSPPGRRAGHRGIGRKRRGLGGPPARGRDFLGLGALMRQELAKAFRSPVADDAIDFACFRPLGACHPGGRLVPEAAISTSGSASSAAPCWERGSTSRRKSWQSTQSRYSQDRSSISGPRAGRRVEGGASRGIAGQGANRDGGKGAKQGPQATARSRGTLERPGEPRGKAAMPRKQTLEGRKFPAGLKRPAVQVAPWARRARCAP